LKSEGLQVTPQQLFFRLTITLSEKREKHPTIHHSKQSSNLYEFRPCAKLFGSVKSEKKEGEPCSILSSLGNQHKYFWFGEGKKYRQLEIFLV